jgi:hypothetical protein
VAEADARAALHVDALARLDMTSAASGSTARTAALLAAGSGAVTMVPVVAGGAGRYRRDTRRRQPGDLGEYPPLLAEVKRG